MERIVTYLALQLQVAGGCRDGCGSVKKNTDTFYYKLNKLELLNNIVIPQLFFFVISVILFYSIIKKTKLQNKIYSLSLHFFEMITPPSSKR